MKFSNRELGALGEEFAANWLISHGYEILDRNWRGVRVELDIVARNETALIFCEVKTRSGVKHGFPSEAVTPAKLRNINSAALQWLQANREMFPKSKNSGIRIDVLSLTYDGKTFEVTHLIDVGAWE